MTEDLGEVALLKISVIIAGWTRTPRASAQT